MGLTREDVDRALVDAAVEAGYAADADEPKALETAQGILCDVSDILVPFLRELADRVREDAFFLLAWVGGGLLDTLVELVESTCEGEG